MDPTSTTINGIPAKYVLAKNPSDATGESYLVAKVLDLPDTPTPDTRGQDGSDATHPNPIRIPSSYIAYNFSETPLHLCDPAHLVTQYRRGDHNLQHRVVDTSRNSYTDEEMKWYADPESKIPEPRRLVMVSMLRCYLCGDFQKSEDDIHYEGVGEHTFGYRYCNECQPYFLGSLYKAIAPILKFRREYEAWLASTDKQVHTHPFIWVSRTRRDKNGERIIKGNTPYLYTKWRIINWVTCKNKISRVSLDDSETVIEKEEDCLTCEQVESVQINDYEYAKITKLVPVRDIYITNFLLLADSADSANSANSANPEYDPNSDDPLNKYSEKEQREMFAAAFTSCTV
jgi:hypothetical protein